MTAWGCWVNTLSLHRHLLGPSMADGTAFPPTSPLGQNCCLWRGPRPLEGSVSNHITDDNSLSSWKSEKPLFALEVQRGIVREF